LSGLIADQPVVAIVLAFPQSDGSVLKGRTIESIAEIGERLASGSFDDERGIADEDEMMRMQQIIHPIETLSQVMDVERMFEFQKRVREVHVVESVRRYILDLIHATRQHPALALGSSPRGSLALFRTAQAHAALHGRNFVIPDDIKHMAVACLAHRIIMNPELVWCASCSSGLKFQ
jgi:hypothetical protein